MFYHGSSIFLDLHKLSKFRRKKIAYSPSCVYIWDGGCAVVFAISDVFFSDFPPHVGCVFSKLAHQLEKKHCKNCNVSLDFLQAHTVGQCRWRCLKNRGAPGPYILNPKCKAWGTRALNHFLMEKRGTYVFHLMWCSIFWPTCGASKKIDAHSLSIVVLFRLFFVSLNGFKGINSGVDVAPAFFVSNLGFHISHEWDLDSTISHTLWR